MGYYILDKTNITNYLNSISKVKKYFEGDCLEIEEIGDGNLNFVFLIRGKSQSSKALILKQAVPYLRCLGKDFALDESRMNYEIRAYQRYTNITASYIPKIYAANESMSAIVMEFLGEHIILRKGLINQIIYPKFAEHIADFLAQNLFKTSSLYLNSTQKRALIEQFNTNKELCRITEDFVFTFPFMEHATNDVYAYNNEMAKELFSDMNFKKSVLELKYKFMTQSDSLLHGDLHTGSIMLSQKETYIIDPEFSFVGPFGFDIGVLIANIIISYVSHVELKTSRSYRQWIIEVIVEILTKFQDKFLTLWNKQKESSLICEGFINAKELKSYKHEFMLNILRDTVGYAGSEMTRRMFGASGVEDIQGIQNVDIRNAAIRRILYISKRFVKEYNQINSVEDIIKIVQNDLISG